MPLVLLLFEYPTLNGGERSILTTVDNVRGAGFDVQAIAPPTGPLVVALRRKNVRHWPLSFAAGARRRDLRDIREDLADAVTRIQPDLLHANSLSMARIAGPIARQFEVKSIGHLRDIVGTSQAAVNDLNCHDRLLAVSNATREFHISGGVEPAKLFTLYNGVNLVEFQPRKPTRFLHQELGIPDDNMLIGAFGQISLRKGFDVFLKSAEIVAAADTDVNFLVVGERYSQKDESRQFEAGLHEFSQRPALSGRIHFLGFRDDVRAIMPELTMLIHPARQEPLGRVLLEAAACGIPIVATDVGGTREILGTSTSAGRLVAADDVQALTNAICELLDSSVERKRLGSLARAQAEVQFDHRKSADALIRHYRTVAEIG
jgi:glycosyltransferase involved in cell wall biosynthesis